MRRTQIGWIVIVASVFVEAMAIYQYPGRTTFLIVTAGMIALVLLFCTLSITVTDDYVMFSFGIGLIKGKYQLSEISSCRPLSYIPMGWGIRFRPEITIFNVSGYKAIELIRKNKTRKIWIGTAYPEEVALWINEKLKKGVH